MHLYILCIYKYFLTAQIGREGERGRGSYKGISMIKAKLYWI